jgi:hypothetical protein
VTRQSGGGHKAQDFGGARGMFRGQQSYRAPLGQIIILPSLVRTRTHIYIVHTVPRRSPHPFDLQFGNVHSQPDDQRWRKACRKQEREAVPRLVDDRLDNVWPDWPRITETLTRVQGYSPFPRALDVKGNLPMWPFLSLLRSHTSRNSRHRPPSLQRLVPSLVSRVDSAPEHKPHAQSWFLCR